MFEKQKLECLEEHLYSCYMCICALYKVLIRETCRLLRTKCSSRAVPTVNHRFVLFPNPWTLDMYIAYNPNQGCRSKTQVDSVQRLPYQMVNTLCGVGWPFERIIHVQAQRALVFKIPPPVEVSMINTVPLDQTNLAPFWLKPHPSPTVENCISNWTI